MKTKRNIFVVFMVLLCVVLTAVSALALTGCKNGDKGSIKLDIPDNSTEKPADNPTENPIDNPTENPIDNPTENPDDGFIKMGTGSKTFIFAVVTKSGEQKFFKISTDADTVGAALIADGVKLIAGDESEYGLYVKTVDGETLDYTADGYYWAFYISEDTTLERKDYASTGVDSTPVEEGKIYAFVAEKA